jgi:glycosyltransferase involved in cell wall biosynthesis
MAKKIRICHFLNYLSGGGTEGMIISLMRRSEHDHTYVTFRATDQRRHEFKDSGLKLVELGSEDIPAAIEYMKKHADIVSASNSGGPEPGVHIGRQAGKPVVEICQSPSLPTGHLDDWVQVVPVSQGILHYWPKDICYSRVIYSCAEPVTRYDKFEACKMFGLDANRPVVGRVGRLEGIKRPQDFVEAAAHIAYKNPQIQFLLVGDGNDGSGVRGMVENYNRRGLNIVMPGFLTGDDKDMAYSAMDVFLYPTSQEGFGIVFAEAMSIGLPIITYSDPVNCDIVGSAGVYTIDNVFVNSVYYPFEMLSLLTLELLRNKREYNKLSQYGKENYQRRFTPEIMTQRYDELYEEIFDYTYALKQPKLPRKRALYGTHFG